MITSQYTTVHPARPSTQPTGVEAHSLSMSRLVQLYSSHRGPTPALAHSKLNGTPHLTRHRTHWLEGAQRYRYTRPELQRALHMYSTTRQPNCNLPNPRAWRRTVCPCRC